MSYTPEQWQAIYALPALNPPDGVTANFVDAPNQQTLMIVLTTIALAILLVFVSMRLVTQWLFVRRYWTEDFIMLLATTLILAYGGIWYAASQPGYAVGYHQWDVTVGEVFETAKLIDVPAFVLTPAYAFVKFCILLQIRRIFVPTRRTTPWFWFGLWLWLITVPLFHFIMFFLEIFRCTPRDKEWNLLLNGTCIADSYTLLYALSWFNVISDFMILILPMGVIYSLQMKTKKKLLVLGVFSTGVLACVTSIIRLYYSALFVYRDDKTWFFVPVGLTPMYEIVIGAVVFCLPVTPKFFQHMSDSIRAPHMWKKQRGKPSDQEANSEPYVDSWDRPQARKNLSLGISSVDQYVGRRPQDSGHTEMINLQNSSYGASVTHGSVNTQDTNITGGRGVKVTQTFAVV